MTALRGSLVSERVIWLCSPRACASKPPCGSCRCSSSVVDFRCSMTRRVASQGAQAVTWFHNQCASRLKHSWVNFLTASLCVPLALVQRCLIFTFGCFCALEAVFVLFLFWLVWILRSSLFRLYSHCRCVPALRGQPFTEVQDAIRTPKNTAVMLIAFWRSSGFPLRQEQACKFLVCSPSFLLSSVPTSSLGGKDLSVLLLQLEFTGRLRRLNFWRSSSSRVATSICTKQPSLGTSGAGRVDDCSRRVCCSFSRRTWRGVSREVQNGVAFVCDGYLASLGLDVQGY